MQVVLPVALVFGAVDVNVDAIAVSLVVLPLAFIDIAVCVPELSRAISLVLAPLTFVLGAIRPNLDAGTMAHSIFKISCLKNKASHSNLSANAVIRAEFELAPP